MKIATIILSVIAVGLIIYNATKLNFDALFEGDSLIASIVILASLCVVVLLQILTASKRIEKLAKQRS
ncbi:MAG: hypothetical protein ACSHXF_04345 [Aquaticitalea sp.]